MTIAALHWHKLLPVAPAASTIVGLIDAVYTAGIAATYYDGASRVPGAGSAWAWLRDQPAGVTEAAYASPPTATALAQRILVAGAAGAKAPTMRTPDTWQASTLLAGVNKNSGAYGAWDAALPFTAGQWFGFWRACNFPATVALVHMIECEEAVVLILESTAGACAAVVLGAPWDPYSTDPLDAEADGRVYGMLTGGQAALNTAFLSSSAQFLGWGAANGLPHTGCFVPGAAGIRTLQRQTMWTFAGSAGMLSTPSGRPVTLPSIDHYDLTTSNFIGRLRQIEYCSLSRTGRRLSVGGTDEGYVLGCVSGADDDAVLLVA